MACWYCYSVSGLTYSNVIVQGAYNPVGSSWATPVNISSPGIRNPADLTLSLSFNQASLCLLTWTNSYDGASFTIEGAFSQAGVWIPPASFLSSLYVFSHRFTVTSSGYAFGAFMNYDPVSNTMSIVVNQANTYATTANVSPYGAISTGIGEGYPSVAGTFLGGLNLVAAIWSHYDGVNISTKVATGTSGLVQVPTNLQITQNSNYFGIFTEYYNTLTWNAPTDPTIRSVLIFRNGQLINAGTYSLTEYIDHNRTQNQTDTYGLVFVDLFSNQSTITTITLP